MESGADVAGDVVSDVAGDIVSDADGDISSTTHLCIGPIQSGPLSLGLISTQD